MNISPFQGWYISPCRVLRERRCFDVYKQKFLQCKDCGQEFEFTPGEQQFYAEKGFTNEPSRMSFLQKGAQKQPQP